MLYYTLLDTRKSKKLLNYKKSWPFLKSYFANFQQWTAWKNAGKCVSFPQVDKIRIR